MEDAARTEMPMSPQALRQPDRQRYIPQAAALRARDLPLPLRALDAELPLVEIDVAPLERHDFSTSQPGLSAEQHDQLGTPIERPRRIDECLVRGKVVKLGCRFLRRQQSDRAARAIDDVPLDALLQ